METELGIMSNESVTIDYDEECRVDKHQWNQQEDLWHESHPYSYIMILLPVSIHQRLKWSVC